MSILSRLFGAAPKKIEPVEHQGFRIYPDPVHEAGGFRVGARIEKDVDGEAKVHRLIRADTYASAETAQEASVAKARQVIDQLGERIFD